MHLGFSSMNTADDPPPAVLAVALEAAGFESLWYGEHSHIPRCRSTPYPAGGPLPEPYRKMMDPYLALMSAAAATTTLKLGTGIALLLERELFSQAKTIATLDRLSGGRLLLGVGVGWNREAFANASRLPWERRYRAIEETVAAQRALFTEAEPSYHGELIRFDPVWFEPKPLQAGGPKVLLGVMGPQGIRHAARWADGWMPVDIGVARLAPAIAAFRRAAQEFGRDPDALEITLAVMQAPDADMLKRLRDLGIHRANIGVGTGNWDQPHKIMPMIEQFAKIIPALAN
jgi:probable F420-dependent oxidoreductase